MGIKTRRYRCTTKRLSTSGGNLTAARKALRDGGIEALAAYAQSKGWPTKFYTPNGEEIGR